MKTTVNVEKWMSYGVYAVFVLAFVYVAYKSLSDSYLWYDEAGQFYISKGLSHYAKPFAPYSGIKDVIHYNRYFNLDPGGFSILLHYWSLVSNHYVWLRLLPFLFFMSALFVTYKIGMHLFHNHFLAVLLTSVILLAVVFSHIAGEIRAYTMEMLGVLLSLYYLHKNANSLTISKLVILALMLDVFMTSRYGFVVYSFAFSLGLVFLMYKKQGFRSSLVPLSIYAAIVLCGVLTVYFVTMRYQNANAEPLTYVSYMGRDLKHTKWCNLSRCYYLIISYTLWCHFKKIPQNLYICFALIVSTVFIILSFANLYPWDEQRTMSATVCSYLAIGIMIMRHLNKHQFLLTILFFTWMFHLDDTNKNIRGAGKEFRENFDWCIKHKKAEDIVFIGRMNNPEVRYLFEEGMWRNQYQGVYPSQLYLGNGASHNRNGEKLKIDIKTAEDVDAAFYLMNENAIEKLEDPSLFKLCEGHRYLYQKVKNE